MKFNSANKKILIVSDIHNEVNKLDKIIKHESADINVCLGDWFDSFYKDEDIHYKNAAAYLIDYLSAPNNYTLFGNHDLHYLFKNNRYIICSGYEDGKYISIDGVLGENRKNIINRFNWFFFIDDILCTHAGLHPNFINPAVKNNGDLEIFLANEAEQANIAIATGQNHWFYFAGASRGGRSKAGGIVWLDFAREFAPIDGLKQIVGHTYHRNLKVNPHHSDLNINPIDCENLCIDNGLNEYVIISNGKLEIKKFIDI